MAVQRRTSLKDLAQKLGVSIATVSRALRNSPEIGHEMRERVKALALELNYRPNPFARGLRQDGPKVIGVVVPNLLTHYYAAMLDGIEQEAAKNGYSVVSANSHENYETEKRIINNFMDLHLSGIIACLAQNTVDYQHFRDLQDMNMPLVFLGRTCMSGEYSSVMANGDEAAQMATQHLIDTGSRKIAFLGGPNNLDMVQRRKHGYLEALRDNRIPIDRFLVACDVIDYDVARNAAIKLLQREERPDAILAFNDILTFAAYTAIKQMGLRIPEDVALIGFTDDPHTKYVTPELSVIVDQSEEMGRTACCMLLRHIAGETAIQRKIVPQQLVIRETSAKNKESVCLNAPTRTL